MSKFKRILLYFLVLLLFVPLFLHFKDYFQLGEETLEEGERVQLVKLDSEIRSEPVAYTAEVFSENLEVPWSIVFTDTNRVLVTERPGRLRQIVNGQLISKPLVTLNEVSSQAEEGLMGLALDPDYETNKLIYLSYAYPKNDGLVLKVISVVDNGDTAEVNQTIINDIPAARFHAGSRIKFGPDNKLYVTTGDAIDKNIAQDLDSLGGKVLRLNTDGSIPVDNPFPNSAIYSLGHRNPQGIDWHPVTEELFSTEHGPSGFDGPGGGDEVNLIKPGGNYGWPLVSHENLQEGLIDPILLFTPAEAPGSGMFYSADIFPQFKNNFFFGALRGEGVVRIQLDPNNTSTVLEFEKLDLGNFGRIREVTQGPDGFIYFATSNQDGRGETKKGDDKILRIVPKDPTIQK